MLCEHRGEILILQRRGDKSFLERMVCVQGFGVHTGSANASKINFWRKGIYLFHKYLFLAQNNAGTMLRTRTKSKDVASYILCLGMLSSSLKLLCECTLVCVCICIFTWCVCVVCMGGWGCWKGDCRQIMEGLECLNLFRGEAKVCSQILGMFLALRQASYLIFLFQRFPLW